MTSDALSPRTWLARHPLQAGECLYAIFGSASDAAPLQAYYREDSPPLPLPLWNGTPYADWQPVMPYLAKLSPSSVFLDWAASEKSRDWGWLAVSTWSTDAILEHLRSLTQVRMPDGSEVFFRFWDGRETGQGHLHAARPYPWWEVPRALVDTLHADDPTTAIDNLLQWLRENHADLYFAYPERSLQLRARRLIAKAVAMDEIGGLLLNQLEKDLTP
ncbi:TPA: DUF4123 domain-containing protein [Pseudomonas aeruginosa]|nr:DUF4123 domain-containing protein [Pseudomonas aeruginosa]